MCPGSKSKDCSNGTIPVDLDHKTAILLELSAYDDLIGFKNVASEEGLDVNRSTYWYSRKIGSKKLGFEDRTPLMIASMFGSKLVLTYILQIAHIDVNKASNSDGATALHCAVAGSSPSSFDIVKHLLHASADINAVDSTGNRPVDLVTPALNTQKKLVGLVLTGGNGCDNDEIAVKDCVEKKEYPVDLLFPDIKNGIYTTDEFRMYMFKVKPCSRAYSHDWTECPFAHPGENARRRDPRMYHYSNVPCPEFRKGTCRQGDACEYAHGIFECWLHPAQYRTRLCKDETGCARKVCFFAHKPEELRPLYASTGSAVPSNRGFLANGSMDVPFSPGSLSPIGGSMWGDNQIAHLPPLLNLSGSRLKTTLTAREMELEGDSCGLGSLDPSVMYQLQGLSINSGLTHLRQNLNRSSFPSSPSRTSPSFIDCSVAGPVASLRSAAFAKRSQSFIDRGTMNHRHVCSSTMATSDWGSPDGKLDWGIQKEELSKLRKSASFGFCCNDSRYGASSHEPNRSWVEDE